MEKNGIFKGKDDIFKFLNFRSVRARILFWGGISLILVAGFIIGYAALTLRENAIISTGQEISGFAGSQAGIINTQLEVGLVTTRSFANALAGAKDSGVTLSRNDVTSMLESIIKENPRFAGMAACYEPNAFDGNDKAFVNTPGTDATGRFIPYFGRGATGEIKLEPLVDYETPGVGDWYLIPRQTKMETLVEPYLYPIQGRDVIMTTTDTPVIVGGKFLGVITADTNLEEFQKMADNLSIYNGKARMYVISNGGAIVAATKNSSLIGKSLDESGLGKNDISDIKAAIESGKSSSLIDGSSIKSFAVFTPGRTNTPWLVYLTVPIADATSSANAMVFVLIGIGAFFIIIGLFLLFISTTRITRPIIEITEEAKRISRGDITRTFKVSGDDEIGTLSQAFADVVSTFQLFRDEISTISTAVSSGNLNVRGDVSKFQGDYAVIIDGINEIVDAMAGPLQEAMHLSKKYSEGDFTSRMNPDLYLEGELLAFRDALNTIGINVSKALTGVKTQLEDLTVQMQKVSGQVDDVTKKTGIAHKNVEEVSERVTRVATITDTVNLLADKGGLNTQQILTAMQDLTSTVSSVSEKIEEVSVLTGTAFDLSEKGKDSAGLAEVGMQSIIQSSSAINQMNQEIGVQMEEIGRIVDIISSISEETNLLALNAAIEAARAGEAGRGFAVVASEVKELANESQKSAENIAVIISGLQKKLKLMADAIQKSITEVNSGNTAVSETLVVFSEIVRSISIINSNMSEVASASAEQAASVQEVTATVNEFGEIVIETAKESAGLASATEESSSAVGNIRQMVAEVNESMEQIKKTTLKGEEAVHRIEIEMDRFRY